jgi:hypothetical protein
MNKETYKEVVSYLKEQIVTLGQEQKTRKHEHRKAQSEQRSWNEIWKLNPYGYKVQLTLLHMAYNKIRNKKPHTGSEQSDRLFLENVWRGQEKYDELIKDLEMRFFKLDNVEEAV